MNHDAALAALIAASDKALAKSATCLDQMRAMDRANRMSIMTAVETLRSSGRILDASREIVLMYRSAIGSHGSGD